LDEAGEEGICFIITEGVLGGPGSVVFGEPEEVVVLQVYTGANEVKQEWMAFVECQDVQGLKEPGFEDRDVCCLKARLLMGAVVGTGVSEGFLEEGMWQRPHCSGCIIGTGLIVDGREGEVACIERLIEAADGL